MRKPKSEPAEAFEDEGILVDSGRFSGVKSNAAKKEIINYIEEKGLGKESSKLQAEGLGHFAAALLGHTHPRDLLRSMRHGPGAGRRPARNTAAGCKSYGQRRFSTL